jgi:hypothetical protein
MTKALLVACALGLSVSASFACDYHVTTKSGHAVDPTTVASISTPASPVTAPDTLQTPAVPVEEPAE